MNIETHEMETQAFDALLKTLKRPAEVQWRKISQAAETLGQAQLSEQQAHIAANSLCMVLANQQTKPWQRLLLHALRMGMRVALPLCLAGIALAIWHYYGNLDCKLDSDCEGPYWGMEILTGLGFYGFCILSLWVALLSVPIDLNYGNRTRAAAARALGRLRISESAGPLAKAVLWRRWIRATAVQALNSILPTLTAEHYGQCEAELVPNLCRILNRQQWLGFMDVDELEMESAILKALEKVGDARAITTIQRLAKNGRSPYSREAAQRLLPILLERQNQEIAPQMLLRGSHISSASPEQLLRPASNTVSEPPEVLLRPAGAEEARP
ncbi:MAG TPA: hypothetical protein VKU00_03990 [Chthonomonadaceae bacterium]|nr:hypothetical protein [Chthonomonadaceae bacterium]